MTFNGVIALVLRYFTEFGSFRDAQNKTFTLAISYPDEFLVNLRLPSYFWNGSRENLQT